MRITTSCFSPCCRDGRCSPPRVTRPEANLIREVRHELVMLPYYGVFDNLSYRVDGYTVTLSGPSDAADAEERRRERREGN